MTPMINNALDQALAIARTAGRASALNDAHKIVCEMVWKAPINTPEYAALMAAARAIAEIES